MTQLINIDKDKKLIVYVDFPWYFADRKAGTKFGAGAGGQYPLMTNAQALKFYKALSVLIENENVAIFNWSTSSHTELLFQCLWEMKDNGFRFATLGFNWMKRTKAGRIFVGPGSYTGKSSELCWLFVKGSMMPNGRKLTPEGIFLPKTKHSKKPDLVYEYIEGMYVGDEYQFVELFQREPRAGWIGLGNAITKNDIFEDIKEIFK